MKKVSAGLSRSAAAKKGSNGRPLALLEGLEDRRLMSVGTVQDQGAVRIETSLGRMTFLLTPDVTPQTVANFLKYVDNGIYNNTIVHRSVPGFVIQAGGYKATSGYSHVTTYGNVPNEFDRDQAAAGGGKVNIRGTVAMAKLGSDPNSATSEFFVNLDDNSSNLDGQNGGFTTFAKVIGGGIHVADAIASLQTGDESFLNSAFTDLPLLTTATGTNFVTISSAKPQRVLPVTLDKSTKYVTWVDEKGSTTTISLSNASDSVTADLTFVGGSDMTYKTVGNRVVIIGRNVDLEQIAAKGTNASSVLSINSVGGKGPAHIGDISVTGSLAQISAGSVQLVGDISSTGKIGKMNFQGTYRSNISTTGGTTDLHIGTALDTSVKVSGGTLNSLTVGKWLDDGMLSTSVSAAKLNSMTVTGNFLSDIAVTGDAGKIVINGNVGTLGDRNVQTWTVGGNAASVRVGKILGLKVNVTGALNQFTAREVLSAQNGRGQATAITAGSIGRVNLATLTYGSSIVSSHGIQSIAISGSMDSSTIRAVGNIGSVSAASVTGNYNSAPSGIYAGLASTPAGLITSASRFVSGSTAMISKINIGKGSTGTSATFSNAYIAAPNLGAVNLGKVRVGNSGGVPFGVVADKWIGQLNATTSSGKQIALTNAKTQQDVDSYITKKGLKSTDGKVDYLHEFQIKLVD